METLCCQSEDNESCVYVCPAASHLDDHCKMLRDISWLFVLQKPITEQFVQVIFLSSPGRVLGKDWRKQVQQKDIGLYNTAEQSCMVLNSTMRLMLQTSWQDLTSQASSLRRVVVGNSRYWLIQHS